MLIVNDGSTDDTLKIALDFASQDDRINVVDQENGGLSSARNAGIKQAKGNYIHFLDSDDFVLEGFYSAMLDSFNTSEKADAIVCGYQYYSNERGFFHIVEGQEKVYTIDDFLVSAILMDFTILEFNNSLSANVLSKDNLPNSDRIVVWAI